jgi:hypothetical protein
MASRMTMSYWAQVAQMNEEPPWESSLDLRLTQHPHDEDLEPQEVCPCFKIEPLWAWYYCISPNFHTLVILLQVDFDFCDELETIYEGFYKIKNIFIFTWSSIFGVRHYYWLHGLIYRLPSNSKVDYLIHIIRWSKISCNYELSLWHSPWLNM